jgi:hypothetical protein
VASRRDLRICFVNRVEREHAAVLAKATAHGAAAMVLAGFSTTASGLGLRVCAELVQEAYGLDSVRTCIEQGYCGVRVCGDEFLAWLHWPLP